jgi:hypothetical protein
MKRPGRLAQGIKRDNERGRIEADGWGMHESEAGEQCFNCETLFAWFHFCNRQVFQK